MSDMKRYHFVRAAVKKYPKMIGGSNNADYCLPVLEEKKFRIKVLAVLSVGSFHGL